MRHLLLALLLLAPAALFAQGKTSGTAVQIQLLAGPGHFCLDARQGRDHDGDPVQIYACNGTLAQQWTIASSPDNKHAILGIGGYCLDVSGGNSTATGTPAQLWKCHFGDNQRYNMNNEGRIVEARSHKCLVASAPHDSAPVVLAPCQNVPGELWGFVRH